MGTNYYLRREDGEPCPHCGRSDKHEDLHIGKSSAGWCFSLNTHPAEGINSLDDWQRMWSQPGVKIVDEYGADIQPDEMMRTITERSGGKLPRDPAFYEQNHAAPGPNNLLRHQVNGWHCIAHGDGTYDLMRGEFC